MLCIIILKNIWAGCHSSNSDSRAVHVGSCGDQRELTLYNMCLILTHSVLDHLVMIETPLYVDKISSSLLLAAYRALSAD